jgi:hypothetical protein
LPTILVKNEENNQRMSAAEVINMKDLSTATNGLFSKNFGVDKYKSFHSDTESDDSDYGLYEDMEETIVIKAKTSALCKKESSSDLFRRHQEISKLKNKDLSRMIVYTVKNSHAHTSCRSFEKTLESNSPPVSVCISMTGVRIVQDSMGLHAEFHVKMSLGEEEFMAWKTFNDFKDIAKACSKFAGQDRRYIWPAFSFFPFAIEEDRKPRTRSYGRRRLRKTLQAWEKVVTVKSERNWFGQISVASLMAESNALEEFLESLLFEIPDVDILLEFLDSNDYKR